MKAGRGARRESDGSRMRIGTHDNTWHGLYQDGQMDRPRAPDAVTAQSLEKGIEGRHMTRGKQVEQSTARLCLSDWVKRARPSGHHGPRCGHQGFSDLQMCILGPSRDLWLTCHAMNDSSLKQNQEPLAKTSGGARRHQKKADKQLIKHLGGAKILEMQRQKVAPQSSAQPKQIQVH